MANATLKERVEAIYKNPAMLANAKDYLNMLAESEGTANQGNNGYNIMFRGGQFADFSKHPNQRHEYIDKQGRKGVSTAAGRYQFLKGTYDGVAKQLGITDFSPESQDKVAIALMLEKGVDFNDGADFATNVGKINNTWTSLAGSALGSQYHSTRSPQFNLDSFNRSRIARGLAPVTTKWNNIAYQSPANIGLTATAGLVQNENGIMVPANIKDVAARAQSYLESIGLPNSKTYLGEAMANIRNKTYADSGYIPWQMYQGNKLTVSSNPYLTEGNLAAMEQRLHNTNPNVQYGVSSFGDGLHPTVAIKNPDGTVGIGTDVATTISVAPALSDGGVPVEDATRAQQQQATNTQPQPPANTTRAKPATTGQKLPTAKPKNNSTSTATSAGASATSASTPHAGTGASQTATTQPATTGTPADVTQTTIPSPMLNSSPAEMLQAMGLSTAPDVPVQPLGTSSIPRVNIQTTIPSPMLNSSSAEMLQAMGLSTAPDVPVQPLGTSSIPRVNVQTTIPSPMLNSSPAEMLQAIGLSTAPNIPVQPLGTSSIPKMNAQPSSEPATQSPFFDQFPVSNTSNETATTPAGVTVGAWNIPVFTGNPYGGLDPETASAILQNTSIRPADMPRMTT